MGFCEVCNTTLVEAKSLVETYLRCYTCEPDTRLPQPLQSPTVVAGETNVAATTDADWVPEVGHLVYADLFGSSTLGILTSTAKDAYSYRTPNGSGHSKDKCNFRDASAEWLTKDEIEPFIKLRAEVLGVKETDVVLEINSPSPWMATYGYLGGGLVEGETYRFLEEGE